jgi:hypothetical protein
MRRLYGAPGLHLLALIASFALAAAALAHFLDTGAPINIVAWFVGAIIAHDLILFPLYAGLDRIAGRLEPKTRVPVVNHIRIPALLSGLLLIVSRSSCASPRRSTRGRPGWIHRSTSAAGWPSRLRCSWARPSPTRCGSG